MNIERLSGELKAEIAQRQVELSMLKTMLETLQKLEPRPTIIANYLSPAFDSPEPVKVTRLRGRRKASHSVEALQVAPAPPKKRNMSPEGRKRIAEAVRARWAKQKAAQKKPQKKVG